MDKKLFRQVSLDRLSSPEQIDHLLRVTSARGWVALLTLWGVLAAALIWGLTGSIDTTVTGSGVLAHTGGVDTVVATGGGVVMNIAVKVGESVKAGQVVAHVAQPALAEKLREAYAELAEARRSREKILADRANGNAARSQAMQKQVDSYERDIVDNNEQIRLAKEQIPVDEELLKKGLITKQTAIQDLQKISTLESNVQKLGAQIGQVQAEKVNMQSDASRLALDLTSKISDLMRNLESLHENIGRTSEVTSHLDGRVVEIQSYQGALVNSGQPIVSIEPSVGSLKAYAYISAAKVKEIQRGMEVHLSPSGVHREEHGYMIGTVDYVAEYPATLEAIVRTFENETLARSMIGEGPVTRVDVRLLPNDKTPSGYTWSTRKGSPTKITSGSVCDVEVVSLQQRPIDLVLPYMKRQLGL
jgi:HlyD family secretion protein